MGRLRSCTICGKIHSTDNPCAKPITRGDATAYALRQSNRWHTKSNVIREQSHYLCAVCLDHGIINHEGIDVHHIKKLRDHPELLLDDDNLVCLCKTHHKQADDGLIEPEYLYQLVKKRQSQ